MNLYSGKNEYYIVKNIVFFYFGEENEHLKILYKEKHFIKIILAKST